MDNKLLIRILELLVKNYPEIYYAERLAKHSNCSLDGGFYSIIKYLEESKKVNVKYNGPKHTRLQQGDEISITIDGIDFLENKKILISRKRMNKSIKWATIIIAITAILNLIVSIIR